jgi:hypothetical protein
VNSKQTILVLNTVHSFGKIEHIMDNSSSATKGQIYDCKINCLICVCNKPDKLVGSIETKNLMIYKRQH